MPARTWPAACAFAASLGAVLAFSLWAETSPQSLKEWSREDGPIENATAATYFVAGLLFLSILRSRAPGGGAVRRSIPILALGVGCFVVAGEEISWGQRLFSFATPDALREINRQEEFNLHNFDKLHDNIYRLQSLAMLAIGLGLPLLTLTRRGAHLLARVGIPVSPFRYAPLFVGAYLYNRAYFPLIGNSAMEARELLMALGMGCFAAHGVVRPESLFRRRSLRIWLPARKRRSAPAHSAGTAAGLTEKRIDSELATYTSSASPHCRGADISVARRPLMR